MGTGLSFSDIGAGRSPGPVRIAGGGVAVMDVGQRRGGIFISYRREETAGQAGRLYDRLSSRFGAGRVFMDVDSIGIGVDFTRAITEALSECDILLALIGREWLTAADGEGRRRVDDPDDFVRVEIETALQRDIRVVPVLVDGAVLPQAGDLPPSLRPLVRRQALMISHAGFGSEVSRLIVAVDAVLGAGPVPVAEPGHDTDRTAAGAAPPAGKAQAPPLAEPGEPRGPGAARSPDAGTVLDAAEDPAYVDGLSALLAGRFDEAVAHFTGLQARFPGESLVRERLEKALFRRDCALWYGQGVAAAGRGDWDQAVAAFERVPADGISDIDAYADTAERLSRARWQQHRHRLIDDVRRLHAARQWQATIAAGREVAKFDPATPDPDGLITQARQALAEEALAVRYAAGLRQFDGGDWPTALDTFTGIEHERPGYRDTPALLDRLRQRQRQQENTQRITELQDQLRASAELGDWAAVATASDRLAGLDVAAADPDGLASLARTALLTRLRELLTARQQYLAHLERLQIDPAYRYAAARSDRYRQPAAAQPAAAQPAAAQPAAAQRAARARPAASHPPEPLQRIDVGKEVKSVSWHPDGRRLAIAGQTDTGRADGQPDLWIYDISGSNPRKELAKKAGRAASARDVAFSPDGTRLATAAGDITLWDANTGKKLLEIVHGYLVNAVAFSPDGTRLASGATTARIWDLAGGGTMLLEVSHATGGRKWAFSIKPRATATPGAAPTVYAVAFSPDGTRLATGALDKSALVWDAASGQRLTEIRKGLVTVYAVAFSPDGTRLATGGSDPQIRDATSGARLLQMHQPGVISAVAFSPDGTRLATGSWGGTARVWDAASGTLLLEIAHDGEVRTVAFSPDGSRLATGSDDKSVRIWPVADL